MKSKVIFLTIILLLVGGMTYADTSKPTDLITRYEMEQTIKANDTESKTIEAIKNVTQATVKVRTKNFLSTGFFISPTLVLSCYHTFNEDGTDYILIDHGSETYTGKLIKADINHDLALIEVRPEPYDDFKALTIAKNLKIGQSVFTTGFPQGNDFYTANGMVSALNKSKVVDAPPDLTKPIGQQKRFSNFNAINIDINAGNSGGALYDLDGNVVGVIAMEGTAMHGYGYTIMLEDIKDFLK